MAHFISGIITTFKYTGDLPHIYLKDDYALIPLSVKTLGFEGDEIEPFYNLTDEIRKLAIALSFEGKCTYIETEYFGGVGEQMAIAWHNGKCIFEASTADNAVNQALKVLGVVLPHRYTDEFSTLGLGRYRSNQKVIDEFLEKKNEQ